MTYEYKHQGTGITIGIKKVRSAKDPGRGQGSVRVTRSCAGRLLLSGMEDVFPNPTV